MPGVSPSDLNRSFVGSPSASQPKLKRIEVPQFDGDILKFDNFRQLFENLVHIRDDLTNIQKLYYLKEAFVGPAAEIARDFTLNDRLYSEAWTYILSRYDNPRSVVKTLFLKFTNLKPLKSETEIRGVLYIETHF